MKNKTSEVVLSSLDLYCCSREYEQFFSPYFEIICKFIQSEVNECIFFKLIYVSDYTKIPNEHFMKYN